MLLEQQNRRGGRPGTGGEVEDAGGDCGVAGVEEHLHGTVLFSLALKGQRMTFRGILDYASKHGPWFCKFMEGRIGEQEFGVGGKGEIDGVLEFKEADRVCGDAGCGWLHV